LVGHTPPSTSQDLLSEVDGVDDDDAYDGCGDYDDDNGGDMMTIMMLVMRMMVAMLVVMIVMMFMTS